MPGVYVSRRNILHRGRAAAAAPSAMSLVLAAASSQYLSKTWGSAPTLATKATLAFFIKRVGTSYPDFFQDLYDGGDWSTNGVGEAGIRFNSGDALDEITYNGGVVSQVTSTNTVSDTTTWHQLTFAFDSTQATATARMRIYLDGTEVSYGTQTEITQNSSYHLADSGIASAIGRAQAGSNRYLDAKLAYFYFIDGQALTPSSFTTGAGSGTTHPATYAGTFGTNGFFLDFRGSSPNDQSGQGNNWTANNAPSYSTDVPT